MHHHFHLKGDTIYFSVQLQWHEIDFHQVDTHTLTLHTLASCNPKSISKLMSFLKSNFNAVQESNVKYTSVHNIV